MTTARPVLGIGIEGVIVLEEPSATAAVDLRVSAWSPRWARTVQVPANAAEVLAGLATRFDIVWVSAWGHNAHVLTEELGVAERPGDFLPVQFGKAAAVAAAAGGRPWALLYDGLDQGFVPHGGWVETVDPHVGLAGIDPQRLLDDTLRAGSETPKTDTTLITDTRN